MSKLLIAVPSFNRPYDLGKRTGKLLSKLTAFDWRVFVEPQQLRYYQQVIPSDKIVTTTDNAKIGGQSVGMASYAEKHGYDYVMKLDDDVILRIPDKDKFVGAHNKPDVFVAVMDELLDYLRRTPSIGIVTFPFWREALDSQRKAEAKGDFAFCSLDCMVQTTYVTKPKYLAMMGGFPLTDMAIGVAVRINKEHIVKYRKLQQDPLMETNEGGLSSWGWEGRVKLEKEAIKLIHQKFGVTVELVEKITSKGRIFYGKKLPEDLFPHTRIGPEHEFNQRVKP